MALYFIKYSNTLKVMSIIHCRANELPQTLLQLKQIIKNDENSFFKMFDLKKRRLPSDETIYSDAKSTFITFTEMKVRLIERYAQSVEVFHHEDLIGELNHSQVELMNG